MSQHKEEMSIHEIEVRHMFYGYTLGNVSNPVTGLAVENSIPITRGFTENYGGAYICSPYNDTNLFMFDDREADLINKNLDSIK